MRGDVKNWYTARRTDVIGVPTTSATLPVYLPSSVVTVDDDVTVVAPSSSSLRLTSSPDFKACVTRSDGNKSNNGVDKKCQREQIQDGVF